MAAVSVGLRLLLATVLIVAPAGCGDDEPAGPDGEPATSEEPAATPTPAEEAAPTPDAAGDDAEAADVEVAIEVRGGQVVGGSERVRAAVGDTVALRVVGDVADTVHVHGYDLEQAVTPQEPATVVFAADIPGVFEVELEQRGLGLAELEIGG